MQRAHPGQSASDGTCLHPCEEGFIQHDHETPVDDEACKKHHHQLDTAQADNIQLYAVLAVAGRYQHVLTQTGPRPHQCT